MPNNKPSRQKKTIYHYTVVFEREYDGGYHAFCPALKGCHSQGDSYEETVENIKEAMAVYLESLHAHGELPPEEDLLIQPMQVEA
jgi:predicted RNase H-like HicB family nuclease